MGYLDNQVGGGQEETRTHQEHGPSPGALGKVRHADCNDIKNCVPTTLQMSMLMVTDGTLKVHPLPHSCTYRCR